MLPLPPPPLLVNPTVPLLRLSRLARSHPRSDTKPSGSLGTPSRARTRTGDAEEEGRQAKEGGLVVGQFPISSPPEHSQQLLTHDPEHSQTPGAITRIRSLLSLPEPKLIRVGVKNKGCAGMAYHLEYVDKPDKFDEVVEQDGVKVVIDSKALFSIIGSEMDWQEDALQARFVFNSAFLSLSPLLCVFLKRADASLPFSSCEQTRISRMRADAESASHPSPFSSLSLSRTHLLSSYRSFIV